MIKSNQIINDETINVLINQSLLQAQIFMLDFQASRWLCDNNVAGQAGNNNPTSVPTGVFKTSDGSINLAVAGETIWRRFAEAVDKRDWLEMEEFKDAKNRLKNRDYLNSLIEELTVTKSSNECVEKLEKVCLPHIYFVTPLDRRIASHRRVLRTTLSIRNVESSYSQRIKP